MDFLFSGVDHGAYYHFQAQREPWLDVVLTAGVFLGHWGGLILLAVSIVLLLLLPRTNRLSPRKLAFFLVFGAAAMELLRRLVARGRPDSAALLVPEFEMQRSFPSLGVFALTLSLLTWAVVAERNCSKNWQIIAAYGLAILITGYGAFSQLYFCLHYVTDVAVALVAAGALFLIGRSICVTRAESP